MVSARYLLVCLDTPSVATTRRLWKAFIVQQNAQESNSLILAGRTGRRSNPLRLHLSQERNGWDRPSQRPRPGVPQGCTEQSECVRQFALAKSSQVLFSPHFINSPCAPGGVSLNRSLECSEGVATLAPARSEVQVSRVVPGNAARRNVAQNETVKGEYVSWVNVPWGNEFRA